MVLIYCVTNIFDESDRWGFYIHMSDTGLNFPSGKEKMISKEDGTLFLKPMHL